MNPLEKALNDITQLPTSKDYDLKIKTVNIEVLANGYLVEFLTKNGSFLREVFQDENVAEMFVRISEVMQIRDKVFAPSDEDSPV